MNFKNTVNTLPLITIVIPTLNEARNIDVALQSIIDNGAFVKDLEVLVIDGGSIDATVEIAKCFIGRLQLILIHAPGESVYKALNIGLKKARGKYFIRVDARSEIPNNYIEEVLKGLQMPLVECVGGIQDQYGNSVVGDSIAWVTTSFIGTGGAKFRTGTMSGFVDSVYLGAYRTSTLKSLGGYEDGADYVSEDSFINKRIRDSGKKIYLNANLRILYPAKSTFRQLIKQYLIYGAGKAFLVCRYKKFTSPRQIIPALFLLLMIFILISCFVGWIPWNLFGVLVLFYLLIVLFGNLNLKRQEIDSSGKLWARCLATMCIHFAWPIGFFLFIFSPPLHKRITHWL